MFRSGDVRWFKWQKKTWPIKLMWWQNKDNDWRGSGSSAILCPLQVAGLFWKTASPREKLLNVPYKRSYWTLRPSQSIYCRSWGKQPRSVGSQPLIPGRTSQGRTAFTTLFGLLLCFAEVHLCLSGSTLLPPSLILCGAFLALVLQILWVKKERSAEGDTLKTRFHEGTLP